MLNKVQCLICLLVMIHGANSQPREYDMDELATCGRTINVDDKGIRLIGRGNTAPSNPPLECIVYLMSVYATDDGTNKLQIEVESLTIKDCTVRLDIYNGRTSVGSTLRALSCQYAPTDIIYSTQREVTVKFSRPDKLVHNEYQYSLLIKPFKDQNVPGTKLGIDVLPVGAIIGIVIGCIILIALIILFLWCCCTGRLGNFNVPGQSIFKAPPPKKVEQSSKGSDKSKPQIIDFQDPVVWNTVTTGKFDQQSATTRGSLYQKGAPRIGRRFDNQDSNYRNIPNQRDSMNRLSRHEYEQRKNEEQEARRLEEQKRKKEEETKRLEDERKRKEAERKRLEEEATNRANTSKETLIDDVFETDSAKGSAVTDDSSSVHKRSPSSSPKNKRKKNVPEAEDFDKGNLERYLSMDLQSQPESETISSPLHVNAGVRSKIDDRQESPNASLRRKKKGDKSPLLRHKGKEPDPTALPPEAFEPIFTSALTGLNYPGNQQQQQPFGYPGGFYPYGFMPAGAFAPGPPGTQTYAYAYQTVPQGGAAPQGGAYFVQDTPTQAGGNLRKAFAVEMSPKKRTPESHRRKHDDPLSKKGKGQIRDVIPNPELSLIARGAAPPDPGQGQRSVALKSGTDPKTGIHTTQVVWTDTVPDATDPKPGENPQITRKTITRVTTKSGFAELPPETNILMMEDSEPAFLAPTASVSKPAISYTAQNENLAFYTGEGAHHNVEPPARSSTPTSMHKAPVYNYAIRDRIPLDDSTV